MTTPTPSSAPERATTRRLLLAGAVAGPLFTTVLVAQLAFREGFDLTRHPLSLLALGEGGLVQVANFIAAGGLSLAFAAGVRRMLRGGPGGTWGPALLAIYGAGLVVAGIFTADPALGFPPGTPDGIPATLTFHGTVHAVAPPVAFSALIAACIVLARRFRVEGARRWSAGSIATGVAALALVVPVPPDGASVRLAIGVVLGMAWVAAVGLRLAGRTEGHGAARQPQPASA
jgi:hypothetical membrane protein